MISHDKAQYLISESLDSPLPAADQQALAAHLAGCPGCRRFADQMGAVVARIHAMPQLPASPVVTRGVLERVHDGPPSWAWLRRGAGFLGSPAVAAAGAVALVGALAGTIYLAVSPNMDDAEPRATISAVALAPEDATATSAPAVMAAPTLAPTIAPTEAPVVAAAPPSPTAVPTMAAKVVVTLAPQPTATPQPLPTSMPRPTATSEPAVRRVTGGQATEPPQPTIAAVDPQPVATEAPQLAMVDQLPQDQTAGQTAPEIAMAPVGEPVTGDAAVAGAEPSYDQPAVRRENDRKDQGGNGGGNDRNRNNGGNDNGNNGGGNGGNNDRNLDRNPNNGGDPAGGGYQDPGSDPVVALVEESLGGDQRAVDPASDPAAAMVAEPVEPATPAAVDGSGSGEQVWAADPAPEYDENGQPIIQPVEDQVIEPVPGEGDSSIAVDPTYDPSLEQPQMIEPVPQDGAITEEQQIIVAEQTIADPPQDMAPAPAPVDGLPASDIGAAPVIGAGVPGLDPTIAPDGSVLVTAPDGETGAPTASWIDPASGDPIPFDPTAEGHLDTPVGWAAGMAYYQRRYDDGRVEPRAGAPGGGGFALWSGQDGGPFGSGLGSARLTPGGDRMAFLANGALYLAPTSDPNAAVQVPVGSVIGYDFSPSGDRLAVSDGYTISVYDAFGNGPLIAVGNQGGIPIGAIDWREDGIAVARFDTGEMILFPI